MEIGAEAVECINARWPQLFNSAEEWLQDEWENSENPEMFLENLRSLKRAETATEIARLEFAGLYDLDQHDQKTLSETAAGPTELGDTLKAVAEAFSEHESTDEVHIRALAEAAWQLDPDGVRVAASALANRLSPRGQPATPDDT